MLPMRSSIHYNYQTLAASLKLGKWLLDLVKSLCHNLKYTTNMKRKCLLFLSIILPFVAFLINKPARVLAADGNARYGCPYSGPTGLTYCQSGAVRVVEGTEKRCTLDTAPQDPEHQYLWIDCSDCVEGSGQCTSWTQFYGSSWVDQTYEQNMATKQICDETGTPSYECLVAKGENMLIAQALYHTKATGEVINTGVTSMLVTPPVRTKDYLAYLGQNLGIVKPVYAQGVGFSGLSAIINIWRLFRNLAYLFFVIIFVVVGLMVILRKRLDPRTVVTVQDSLPRLVISLLLVTFSYAIAGLVIDFGDLSTRVIGNLFMQNGFIAISPTGPDPAKLQNLFRANIFELVGPLRNVENLIDLLDDIDAGIPGGILGTQITARLVFQLGAFFIMFKIFFTLLASYVEIVLGVILGPFQLMLGAIPTNSNAPSGWFSKLIANVAVFPVTFTMLALAAILKSNALTYQQVWATPNRPLGDLWSPSALGNWGAVVGELLAYGVLFTIPQVANMTKEALSIKEGRWGGAAAEEMKAGLGRIPFLSSLAK